MCFDNVVQQKREIIPGAPSAQVSSPSPAKVAGKAVGPAAMVGWGRIRMWRCHRGKLSRKAIAWALYHLIDGFFGN